MDREGEADKPEPWKQGAHGAAQLGSWSQSFNLPLGLLDALAFALLH